MFLFRKRLDRRTFLRGMGATVALPLLDAMIPARALLAAMRPTQRLAFVYFPHGAVTGEWIHSVNRQPATGNLTADQIGDRADRLGRILEPLAPFRSRLTVIGGVENRHAYGPVHSITPGTWLSGMHPASGNRQPATGSDSHGSTADQIAAEYLGRDTLLSSISLATEEPRKISAGIWEGQFEASLATTLSFRRGQVPVAMETSPRATFDRMFARSETCDGSVLDRVSDAAASLRTRLGPADRVALGSYFETVRDIEGRLQKLDSDILLRSASYGGQAPEEVEQQFVERLSLMFDLAALAFRVDITRVAAMMMAAEASSMTYGHLGVPESFHQISHHQNDPENLEKLVRIQTFHTRIFATFVRTLADRPDGDASLLDRTTILFGSNMSDSQAHDHFPLPLAMIGGGCGSPLGFRHVQLPDRTPMSNLLLTMLRRAGVPVQSIGDSAEECADR